MLSGPGDDHRRVVLAGSVPMTAEGVGDRTGEQRSQYEAIRQARVARNAPPGLTPARISRLLGQQSPVQSGERWTPPRATQFAGAARPPHHAEWPVVADNDGHTDLGEPVSPSWD